MSPVQRAVDIEVLRAIVLLGVVPAVLVGGIVLAFVQAGRVAPRVRVSAQAGFLAGLMAVTLVTLALPIPPGFVVSASVSPAWYAVVGLPAGLLWPAALFVGRRSTASGLLCFAQANTTSALLIEYAVDPVLRTQVAALTVSALVGTLMAFAAPRRWVERAELRWDARRARRRSARSRERPRGPRSPLAARRVRQLALRTIRTHIAILISGRRRPLR